MIPYILTNNKFYIIGNYAFKIKKIISNYRYIIKHYYTNIEQYYTLANYSEKVVCDNKNTMVHHYINQSKYIHFYITNAIKYNNILLLHKIDKYMCYYIKYVHNYVSPCVNKNSIKADFFNEKKLKCYFKYLFRNKNNNILLLITKIFYDEMPYIFLLKYMIYIENNHKNKISKSYYDYLILLLFSFLNNIKNINFINLTHNEILLFIKLTSLFDIPINLKYNNMSDIDNITPNKIKFANYKSVTNYDTYIEKINCVYIYTFYNLFRLTNILYDFSKCVYIDKDVNNYKSNLNNNSSSSSDILKIYNKNSIIIDIYHISLENILYELNIKNYKSLISKTIETIDINIIKAIYASIYIFVFYNWNRKNIDMNQLPIFEDEAFDIFNIELFKYLIFTLFIEKDSKTNKCGIGNNNSITTQLNLNCIGKKLYNVEINILDYLNDKYINKNIILFKKLFDRVTYILNKNINYSLVLHIVYLQQYTKFNKIKNMFMKVIIDSNILDTIEYANHLKRINY